jgi:hypothetical protein
MSIAELTPMSTSCAIAPLYFWSRSCEAIDLFRQMVQVQAIQATSP